MDNSSKTKTLRHRGIAPNYLIKPRLYKRSKLSKGDSSSALPALAIVVSFWGAASTLLTGVSYLNSLRDRIIFKNIGLVEFDEAYRRYMLCNDFIPTNVALSLCCLSFALIVWNIPGFVSFNHRSNIKTICRLMSALPLFAFIAIVAAGIVDVRFILDRLGGVRNLCFP